jgi:hypothetical protein
MRGDAPVSTHDAIRARFARRSPDGTDPWRELGWRDSCPQTLVQTLVRPQTPGPRIDPIPTLHLGGLSIPSSTCLLQGAWWRRLWPKPIPDAHQAQTAADGKDRPHAAGMRESRDRQRSGLLNFACCPRSTCGLSSPVFFPLPRDNKSCLVKLEKPGQEQKKPTVLVHVSHTGQIGSSHAPQSWRTARAPTASRLETTSRTFAVPLAFQWYSANPSSHRVAATPKVPPDASSRRASRTQNMLTSTKTSKPSKPRSSNQLVNELVRLTRPPPPPLTESETR